MRVVPRRTVVGDIDRRFDNLSGSHHQSHVNCVSSVYGIYVSGQLSRDVIGCSRRFIYIPHKMKANGPLYPHDKISVIEVHVPNGDAQKRFSRPPGTKTYFTTKICEASGKSFTVEKTVERVRDIPSVSRILHG